MEALCLKQGEEWPKHDDVKEGEERDRTSRSASPGGI